MTAASASTSVAIIEGAKVLAGESQGGVFMLTGPGRLRPSWKAIGRYETQAISAMT